MTLGVTLASGLVGVGFEAVVAALAKDAAASVRERVRAVSRALNDNRGALWGLRASYPELLHMLTT